MRRRQGTGHLPRCALLGRGGSVCSHMDQTGSTVLVEGNRTGGAEASRTADAGFVGSRPWFYFIEDGEPLFN